MGALISTLVAHHTTTVIRPITAIAITIVTIALTIITTSTITNATTNVTTGITIGIITVPIRTTGNGITIASMIIGDATMVRCAGMDTGEAM